MVADVKTKVLTGTGEAQSARFGRQDGSPVDFGAVTTEAVVGCTRQVAAPRLFTGVGCGWDT